MRKHLITGTLVATMVACAGLAIAHADEDELPAGPIHDRHELMEGVGKNAKIIGDALKAGDFSPIAAAAREIQASAGKASALFPEGSTHPNSRAMPAIWEKWDEFDKLMKDMESKSGELAKVADDGGDVPATAKAMFGNCKSCHDDFRKPEEKEEKS